jgi:peptidoglycan/xylan/chitin deacetylase (PgdA/CDA1 family)
MAGERALVLTYHAVSSDRGPTSIPLETFRLQMEALAAAGYASMTLADLLDWRAGRLDGRRALITFDDAYLDFREAAHPVLQRLGFSAVVFAPTGRLGGVAAWPGAPDPPRRLMSWADVEALAAEGVEFGAHGVTHADLTVLSPAAVRQEIEQSAAELADRLGRPTLAFAAPYGRVNAAARRELQARFSLAFGVRLDRTERGDDPCDIPRIDMHYFRAAEPWRAFLAGSQTYIAARRLLRSLRRTLQGE